MLIFSTSILIYFFADLQHQEYSKNELINSLRVIWEIADEIGPAVKIALIILFGSLIFIFRNHYKGRNKSYVKSILFALISVMLVLLLLPADYSRGYGIGLTGERLDPDVLPLYLIGAVACGITYSLSIRSSDV